MGAAGPSKASVTQPMQTASGIGGDVGTQQPSGDSGVSRYTPAQQVLLSAFAPMLGGIMPQEQVQKLTADYTPQQQAVMNWLQPQQRAQPLRSGSQQGTEKTQYLQTFLRGMGG